MPTFHTQVVVTGGGICGLWLRDAIEQAGYATILLERDSLGGVQTLASQGMIHGGIKYTLEGFTTSASETIAAMPARWASLLANELTGTRVLSDDYYLFSDGGIASKVTAFFGSKSVRSRVDALQRSHYPSALANESFKGLVYRLSDIVLDTGSLVETLARRGEGRIFKASPIIVPTPSGEIDHLQLEGVDIVADTYIFAAGAGNAALVEQTSLSDVGMQTRPLRQVIVKLAGLPNLYAHAVSLSAGAKPRLTITTHACRDGTPVWYLGGNLAETGVARSEEAQIDVARRELRDLFPWLDVSGAKWRTLMIDRAEAPQADHARPDSPFVRAKQNLMVCWPTKLTLTPLLGDEVVSLLPRHGGKPEESAASLLSHLPAPPIGVAPWDRLF